jgi:hypothetical protein
MASTLAANAASSWPGTSHDAYTAYLTSSWQSGEPAPHWQCQLNRRRLTVWAPRQLRECSSSPLSLDRRQRPSLLPSLCPLPAL